ncbi:MAG: DUF4097 family beta strand repeat protein [Candidatus Aminicenantes bacterium]|nr:MAG: DUF4097 family beta strand repeat protein [Candidatus Aminicenantes bacterium]
MKKIFLVLFVILSIGAFPTHGDSYRVEKKGEINRTLHFQDSSGMKDLQVDNIFGSIVVTGYDGKEVKLFARKTIKARTEGRIQKAEQEVKLDITEEGNVIDIYVDGPFRNQHKNRREWNDPGYQVHYDFDLKVPRKTNIYLKTATDGKIEVNNIEGEFQVRHANGKIVMRDIAGSGTARTANGEVKIQFAKNPDSDCSFKTVNGDVDVTFEKNLSADFLLKTRFGEAYSDFPVSLLPVQSAATEERKNGKYVYRSNSSVGVRVGSGGPQIAMDTLNGNLLIKKK